MVIRKKRPLSPTANKVRGERVGGSPFPLLYYCSLVQQFINNKINKKLVLTDSTLRSAVCKSGLIHQVLNTKQKGLFMNDVI